MRKGRESGGVEVRGIPVFVAVSYFIKPSLCGCERKKKTIYMICKERLPEGAITPFLTVIPYEKNTIYDKKSLD